jgi:hypothetical protein
MTKGSKASKKKVYASGSQPIPALGTQNVRKNLAAQIYQEIFRKIALFQKLQPKSSHFPQNKIKVRTKKFGGTLGSISRHTG